MSAIQRLILVPLAVLIASPALAQSPREQYAHLYGEFEAETAAWHEKYDGKNKSDEDHIARYRDWPSLKFAPKFVAFAEAAGTDAAAYEALLRVVETGNGVNPSDEELLPHYERTLELILRDHRDQNLRPLCDLARMSPAAENVLRTLSDDQESSQEVRAEAAYRLGRMLATKWQLMSDSWLDRPAKTPFEEYISGRWKPNMRKYLAAADTSADYAEAVQQLAIAEELGGVPVLRGTKYVCELATDERFELEHLSPGKQVPDISGVDLLGKAMSLREFHGKVVLLVFWASWCGPCVGDIPHERELAERFNGRPFVIVGVNADETQAAAAEAVGTHQVPWRSFWNGDDGLERGICGGWNVRQWPTLYVIDHEGVIRHKHLRRETLDDPLEKLIVAAEADGERR